MKLFRCHACQAIHPGDAPPATCSNGRLGGPSCDGDQFQEVEMIHFHPPGPGAKRACDGKHVTSGRATALASCVTCPKCLATLQTKPEPPTLAEV